MMKLAVGLACVALLPGLCLADDDLAKGKAIYEGIGACISCHGPAGKGDGVAAAQLNPKPRDFSQGAFMFDTDKDGKTGTETDLFNIVTNGAMAYGGNMMMAPRPDIPEADRRAVIKYVLSLKTK
jgi:cytochrome c551/c552